MTIELLKKANDLAKEIESLRRQVRRLEVLRHRVKKDFVEFVGLAFKEDDRSYNSIEPINIDKSQGIELIAIAIDLAKERLDELEKEFENL